ncbi:hypothetical protein [Polynucleobacter asymbioticus]|jgi:cobalamin biosynthesis protein CobD/CbiB|uniref:hypothetical protein n=1 Tax=Polynucleobacter asymbioticus TaxID=576611 RepID=UPI0008F8282C|nr:hypothetical protein [Polynucleobacter asymbioticus]
MRIGDIKVSTVLCALGTYALGKTIGFFWLFVLIALIAIGFGLVLLIQYLFKKPDTQYLSPKEIAEKAINREVNITTLIWGVFIGLAVLGIYAVYELGSVAYPYIKEPLGWLFLAVFFGVIAFALAVPVYDFGLFLYGKFLAKKKH